jgi:hypothetical protein
MPLLICRGDPTTPKPMTYSNNDYPGLVFGNPEDVRMSVVGEIAEYEIVDAHEEMRCEIGCWLTLSTKDMIKS